MVGRPPDDDAHPDGGATTAAAAAAAPRRPFLRALMYLQLAYLLAIPIAGMSAIAATHTAKVLGLAGWVPVVVYGAVTLKFYQLDGRAWLALILVFLVPAQVAYHAFWLGGGVGGYLVEESFVELVGLTLALTLVMVAYRPSGWGGAGVGAAMAAVACAGWGWPLYERYRAVADRRAWLLLGVVVVTATWSWVQLTAPYARGDVAPDDAPPPDAGLDLGISAFPLLDRLIPRSKAPPVALAPRTRDAAAPVVIVVMTLGWFAVLGVTKLIAG